jgi:tetratricopeptide (TPR) repeat protein
MNARRLPSLVPVLIAGLSLTACAEAPPSSTLGLRAAQTAAAPVERAVVAPSPSSSAFGLYLAGEAAIDHGSSRDAATYFNQASQIDPNTVPIEARAFSSALVAGEVAHAAEAAQRLGDGPEPVQRLGLLTRAVEALAEDKGRQAYALLAAKPVGVEHLQAFQLLAPWAAAAAGDWAAATTEPKIDGDPIAQGVAILGQAELLERAGRFAEAEAVYKTRAGGKDGLFTLGYGAFLERRGRRTDAAALYDKALDDKALVQSPGDLGLKAAQRRAGAGAPPPPLAGIREGAAEALIAPAELMVARREGDNGLAYLRLALRLDPTLDYAWVLVGDAMNGAGDLASAREAYLKVRPQSDQYIAARTRLALLAQQDGDKETALRLARDMLDVSPNDPRPLVVYADLLRDDDRYPEAVEALNRAIKNTPEAEVGWSLYYERGASEERAGDWTAGEADLKRALKLKPNEPEVLNYLGYAWADRGEHLKEALSMLEMAAALEPRSGAIVDSLGWARYRVRQYHDALRDLEHAVTLEPADPEVNSHLGDVYWRLGRLLEARFQWQRVLTLDPDPKIKAAAQLKLAQGLGPETGPNPAALAGERAPNP